MANDDDFDKDTIQDSFYSSLWRSLNIHSEWKGGEQARLIRIYVCANFKQDQRSPVCRF